MLNGSPRSSIVIQAFKFGVVGLANTLVGLGTIYACLFFLGWSDPVANIAGYTLGLIQSFALNRAWTFRSRVRILPGLLRFLAVFAVAYGINLALVLSLRRMGVGPALAHASGMPVYTLVFFLLSRWLVFATAPRTDDETA
jgi:putative flippase GtrA